MVVKMDLALDLSGRPVLVTGCSSGIGLYTAVELSKRGYRVFATARQSKDLEALREMGLETLYLDYTESDSIKAAVAEMMEKTGGKIHGLFNNGAYGQPGAVEDLTREAIREQFETNVFGWMELTALIMPYMRKQGFGRIVMNSSVLGMVTMPLRGAYNASKFAIEGFSDTLRQELKGTGIKVSLVEPGPITSRFREAAFNAYVKHIFPEKSAFRATYESMENRLKSEEAVAMFTLGPDAVYKKVLRALESRWPRTRYYVTIHTYIFAVCRRVLPYPVIDWIVTRKMT